MRWGFVLLLSGGGREKGPVGLNRGPSSLEKAQPNTTSTNQSNSNIPTSSVSHSNLWIQYLFQLEATHGTLLGTPWPARASAGRLPGAGPGTHTTRWTRPGSPGS